MKIKTIVDVSETEKIQPIYPQLLKCKKQGSWLGIIVLALSSHEGIVLHIPEDAPETLENEDGRELNIFDKITADPFSNTYWRPFSGQLSIVLKNN